MRFLLALLLPPLAVLACGKPIQALLNAGLTLCFYFPGAIHALFVVSSHKADLRAERMTEKIVYRLRGEKPPMSPIMKIGGGFLLLLLGLALLGGLLAQ